MRRPQSFIFDRRRDDLSAEQVVVDGVSIRRGAGRIELPTQSDIYSEIGPDPPVVLAVYGPKIVSDVPVADTRTDAQVVGVAQHKISKAGTRRKRMGLGMGRGGKGGVPRLLASE